MRRTFANWMTRSGALMLATGSICLQTAACADNITALASTVTAGGVLFIISRILE